MPEPVHDRQRNRILQQLPRREYERIVPAMEMVTPPLWEVLTEPDRRHAWAYFPLTAVVSTMVVLESGATVEAATVGNEGVVGLSLLVGHLPAGSKYVVQVEGELARVDAERFRQLLGECNTLRVLLLRYALVLIDRGAQNAACIQHHSVEQRMCRWLLETALRKGRDDFGLTQEFLSDLMGVRRQSVTSTAGVLQAANLISYKRGRIEILDRARLEQASCECFRASLAAYDRTMQAPVA